MNFNELKILGYDKDWIIHIKENWHGKDTGKYIMGIYTMDSIDDDPRSGYLITSTYFDTSEDMDNIHRFFEGFGYVMADTKTNETIGEGIIDYSPYDEMEAYTGELWKINIRGEKANQTYVISDKRKVELYDSMLGYLTQLYDEEKLVDMLRSMGFTDAELETEDLLPAQDSEGLDSLIEDANKRVTSDKGKETVIQEYDK